MTKSTLDVFGCYVVGRMIAPRETAELEQTWIADTITGKNVESDCLTLHADHRTSTRSKTVAASLVDLRLINTRSYPYFVQ